MLYFRNKHTRNTLIGELRRTVKIHFIYPCPVALSIFPHLITDFKFIGKVEFQTNSFQKISVLAHFRWFFSSKTNRFTNLYAKLLREKKLEPNLSVDKIGVSPGAYAEFFFIIILYLFLEGFCLKKDSLINLKLYWSPG